MTLAGRQTLCPSLPLGRIIPRDTACDRWLDEKDHPERSCDEWAKKHYRRLYQGWAVPFRWFRIVGLDPDYYGPIRVERFVKTLYMLLSGPLITAASRANAKVKAYLRAMAIEAEAEALRAETSQVAGGLLLAAILDQVAQLSRSIIGSAWTVARPDTSPPRVQAAGGQTSLHSPLN